MAYKLKPVRCDNCKHWTRNPIYDYEGVCDKSDKITREHHVCNLLPTNDDRRNAKIDKWK